MRIELLVDSDQFFASLKKDIAASRDYAFIQTMSFEGDRAGKGLSDLLFSSPCADKRILVDSFTRFKVNDKFLYFPKNLFNSDLRKEVRETGRMIRGLKDSGIGVKFTNPCSPFWTGVLARNHKKMVLIDGQVTYIGGINFSEHNFHWHDMMLRIEDKGVTEFLKKDFLCTWEGRDQNVSTNFDGMELQIWDGHSNEAGFDKILQLILNAKKSVWIGSATLTLPFYGVLRELTRKGVPVTLLTPDKNNKTLLKQYIFWEAHRSGIELKIYPHRMSHLKAILIDDDFLVVGSANFDYLSYRSQQELVAIVTNPEVISVFKEKIIKRDLECSSDFEGKVSRLKGSLVSFGLSTFGRILTFLSRV